MGTGHGRLEDHNVICKSAAENLEVGTCHPSAKFSDAVTHAEYGVVDAGTAGKDTSIEVLVDAHESSDIGSGKRCTRAVVLVDH